MSRKVPKNDTVEFRSLEKGFNLPLKMEIEGRDGFGRTFQEKSVLSYISHQGSSFWMMTPVTIGSELRLAIDLPDNLSDGGELKLIIRGKVVFVEADPDIPTRQRVSLRFENRYIIKPED